MKNILQTKKAYVDNAIAIQNCLKARNRNVMSHELNLSLRRRKESLLKILLYAFLFRRHFKRI